LAKVVEIPARLQIDDRLVRRAQKAGGFRTKRQTVNQALAEFLRRREQRAVARLFGTVDFAPEFDSKRLRSLR
jgi:Arc/MetJ family transcription regulator